MRAKIIIFSMLSAILLAGSFTVFSKSYADNVSVPAASIQHAGLLLQLETSITKVYDAAVINNRQAGYMELQRLNQYMLRYLNELTDEDKAGWLRVQKEITALMAAMESGTLAVNWHQQAAKIRLAIDSQVRPQTALWLQYQPLLKEDLALMRKTLYGQSDGSIQAARGIMSSVEAKFDRMKLAGYMVQEPDVISAAEKRMAHTKKLLFDKLYATKEKRNEIVQSVDALHTVLYAMFPSQQGSLTVSSVLEQGVESKSLGWSLFFGSFIFSVLAFVSWRKYKLVPYGIKPIIKG